MIVSLFLPDFPGCFDATTFLRKRTAQSFSSEYQKPKCSVKSRVVQAGIDGHT